MDELEVVEAVDVVQQQNFTYLRDAAHDALKSLELNNYRFEHALDDIEPIENSENPDLNFCHYIKARVALRKNNARLALEHLALITNTESPHRANLYQDAQTLLRENIAAQAELAKQKLEAQHYRQALKAIEAIEASQTEANFCLFIRAKVAFGRRNPKLALEYLAKMSEAETELYLNLKKTVLDTFVAVVCEQHERALSFLDKAPHSQAIKAIEALEHNQTELDFCHFVRATLARKQNNPTLALSELAKITEASALLPNLAAMVQEMRTNLVREQEKLALDLIDKGHIKEALKALKPLSDNNLEPDFCHYVKARAYTPSFALTELNQILEQDAPSPSAVTLNVNAAAQRLRDEIIHQQAQQALNDVNGEDYASALTKIEALEENDLEPSFCYYIRAKIAQRESKALEALEYLALIEEDELANDNLSTTDLNKDVQDILIGLIAGQLMNLSEYTLPIVATTNNDKGKQEDHFEEVPLSEPMTGEAGKIQRALDPFIAVTRPQGLGIRFDFTDRVKFDTRLRILGNFQTAHKSKSQHNDETLSFFGESPLEKDNFPYYFEREQYFIKGLIAEAKELWSTALAYFTRALQSEIYSPHAIYKSEHSKLRLHYFDQNKYAFREDYTYEQHYAVVKSRLLNGLLDESQYHRILVALYAELSEHLDIHVDTASEASHPASDHQSGDSPQTSPSSSVDDEKRAEDGDKGKASSGEEDANAEFQPPDNNPSPENSPRPQPQEDTQKLRALFDKIERQILLYNPNPDKKEISEFFGTKTKKIFGAPENNEDDIIINPKTVKTREQITGKAIAENYFTTVWNFCWKFKAMQYAAIFFAIPQIVVLAVTTVAFPVIWAIKKHQLAHQEEQLTSGEVKRPKEWEEKRIEHKTDVFQKAKTKENLTTCKRHLLLAPQRLSPAEIEAQQAAALDQEQLRRAQNMSFSPAKDLPGRRLKAN